MAGQEAVALVDGQQQFGQVLSSLQGLGFLFALHEFAGVLVKEGHFFDVKVVAQLTVKGKIVLPLLPGMKEGALSAFLQEGVEADQRMVGRFQGLLLKVGGDAVELKLKGVDVGRCGLPGGVAQGPTGGSQGLLPVLTEFVYGFEFLTKGGTRGLTLLRKGKVL